MMVDQPRRRRRRKDARPDEIIQAALEELTEKGISGSTLGGIAARAGISRTTIYLYFKTKNDIFEGVARATVEQTIDEAAQIVSNFEGPFEQLFSDVMDAIYARLVEGDASVLLRSLVAEGRDHADLVAFYQREILAKGISTIERMIALGIARGELSPHASSLDPRLVAAPAIFAAIWRLVFEKTAPLDVEAFKRDHIRMVLDGILKRSA